MWIIHILIIAVRGENVKKSLQVYGYVCIFRKYHKKVCVTSDPMRYIHMSATIVSGRRLLSLKRWVSMPL